MTQNYKKGNTIAAIITPPGEGAISGIRISGPKTYDVAETIFSGDVKSYGCHTAHIGNILASDKKVIDQVLILTMRGPNSYTGEDTVEIFCHGGSLVTRRVLERIIEAGASLAKPGEFSFQAFMNGKLDLAQAEAVQQLIAAKNELALESAEKQLQGALSQEISRFQKELTETTAILEAWVDFPEEGLEFASMEEIVSGLQTISERMEKLKNTFHDGKALHEGLTLCLLGSPNVGKSSLMNALLGKERAIVTEIAGTTRDLLEEDLRLGSFHFKLIDTAGIRKTDEIVEKEGIRRSEKAMKDADVILLLLDASRPLDQNDQRLIETTPKEKTILVWNKVDLAQAPSDFPSVKISAREKIGLADLTDAIEKLIWKKGPPSKEEVMITRLRHYTALSEAIQSCQAVITGLKTGISPEFLAADMRSALHALSSIIGTNVSEDILSAIFSKFCLGK